MTHPFRLMVMLGAMGVAVACSRPTPIAGVLPSPAPPTTTATATASSTLAATQTPTPQPTSAPSATASAWPTVETATPIVLSDAPPTETPTPTFSAASPTPTRTAVETSTATPFTPGASATPTTPATVTATPTERPAATSTSTPTFTAPPMPVYLSGLTARAREIFVAGQQRGQNAHAFALVGDSNTDNPAFFTPFDAGNYTLGDYAALQDSITYFSGSFGRDSVATVGGFNTSKELDPAFNDPARCAANESPLVCEYRWQRPSVALILLGTGDQHSWTGFEGRYRQIIEYTIAQGIVPVLITKADDLEATDNTAPSGYINGVIVRLSEEYSVPLLDLRQAIAPLPNRGLLPDGFHYNYPVDGQSANFTDGYLDYGFNMRNLTGLQALDAVRRAVMFDTP